MQRTSAKAISMTLLLVDELMCAWLSSVLGVLVFTVMLSDANPSHALVSWPLVTAIPATLALYFFLHWRPIISGALAVLLIGLAVAICEWRFEFDLKKIWFALVLIAVGRALIHWAQKKAAPLT